MTPSEAASRRIRRTVCGLGRPTRSVTGTGATGSFWYDADPDTNPTANQVDWSAGDFGNIFWDNDPNNRNVDINVGTDVTVSGFEIVGDTPGIRRVAFKENGGHFTFTGDTVFRSEKGARIDGWREGEKGFPGYTLIRSSDELRIRELFYRD